MEDNKDNNGNVIENGNIETSGEQEFKTEEDMKWRIWDYDKNTKILRIVGDPTQGKLTLKGAAGYNNGVWAINEICKECYSNEEKGITATSLKRSDIQKVSSYDYTRYKHNQNGNNAWEEVTDSSKNDSELIYFGESKTYSNNNKYPKMWGDNDQSWTYGYDKETMTAIGRDKECTTWEEEGTSEGKMSSEMTQVTSSTTFKQSYYAHTYTEEEFPNRKYYNLIFKKENGIVDGDNYWLAGRYVLLFETTFRFRFALCESRC